MVGQAKGSAIAVGTKKGKPNADFPLKAFIINGKPKTSKRRGKKKIL
jgi:hypothetical protein